jgi:hypothetical protein
MKEIVFLGYRVTGNAKHEQGNWRPHARVSWAGGRQIQELQDQTYFKTEREAEDYALQSAKYWVQDRVQCDMFENFLPHREPKPHG